MQEQVAQDEAGRARPDNVKRAGYGAVGDVLLLHGTILSGVVNGLYLLQTHRMQILASRIVNFVTTAGRWPRSVISKRLSSSVNRRRADNGPAALDRR
jgi:hypothetical protein